MPDQSKLHGPKGLHVRENMWLTVHVAFVCIWLTWMSRLCNEICIAGLVKRLSCHIFFSNFEPFLLNHRDMTDEEEGSKIFALHSATLRFWYRSMFQYRWNHYCCSCMLLCTMSICCSIIRFFFFLSFTGHKSSDKLWHFHVFVLVHLTTAHKSQTRCCSVAVNRHYGLGGGIVPPQHLVKGH